MKRKRALEKEDQIREMKQRRMKKERKTEDIKATDERPLIN